MVTKQQNKVTTTNVKQHDCFLIVQIKDKYKIVLGDSIISQKEFKTQLEAQNYINKKPWELIFNGTLFLTQKMKGEKL